MIELALRSFLNLLVVVDPVGIASTMILVGQAGSDPRGLAVVTAMAAAVLALTWLALRLASPLGLGHRDDPHRRRQHHDGGVGRLRCPDLARHVTEPDLRGANL